MTRIGRSLVAMAAAVVAASVISPASAAESTFSDQRGDVRRGFDIHSVRVVNTGKWIKIRTHHRYLEYGGAQNGGVAVYIDTVRRRNGPEFWIAGPVGFDGDYNIARTRHWQPVGQPLDCRGLRFGVNYKRDVVRFAVTRRCLDRAYDHRVGKVRVAAKTAQNRAGGGAPRVDWAPKRRALYPAVARG